MARWGYLSTALQGLSALLLLAASAWLISRASQQPPVMYLMVAVVGVRAFALGRAGFRYAERISLHNAAFQQASGIRPKLFKALIPFAPGKLGDFGHGNFVSSVIADVDEIQNRIVRFLGPAVQTAAACLASVALSFWLVPEAGFFLLALESLALFAILPMSARFATAANQDIASLRAQLTAANIALFESFAMLSAFGWLADRQSKIRQLTATINRAEKRIASAGAVASGLVNLLSAIAVLSATYLASVAFENHRIDGVTIAVVALLPMAAFEVIQANSAMFGVRMRNRASAKRINDLLELQVEAPIQILETEVELPEIQSLELQGVSVGYAVQAPVFANLNLMLAPSESVAVKGPSGSGKTTLAYLLLRFLEPLQGDYRINGQPASDFSANSIRHRIGYVEQNPNIFMGSIRDNLLIAKPEANDKELLAVLEAVKLDKTFGVRDGLQTQLGERGSQISGGEAQRVAIARALLADFEVIIFDEPTSNLDSKTAGALLDDIFELAANRKRSLVLISHDPEVANRCDLTIELTQPIVEGV